MVYECDQCSAALPAGVLACPHCGEQFDEAVPADALIPKVGFSAAEREAARQEERTQAEADFNRLRQQMVGLEDEVLTLRSQLAKLTGLTGTDQSALLLSHQAALESCVEQLEHQAALQAGQIAMLVQYASGLESQIEALTNRLTVAEMAGRENKRRFVEHVKHVKDALSYVQISSPVSAAGQGQTQQQ